MASVLPLPSILTGVVVLAGGGGLAALTSRRGQARAAMAALVLAPVVAVLALVAAGGAGRHPAAQAPDGRPVEAPAMASEPRNAPVAAPGAAAPGASAASIAPLSGARPGDGRDAEERARAQRLRVERKFPEARDAFRRLAGRRPDDADAWADAADCAAAAEGGNLEAGVTDIDRALAAQPNHPKALWLKASLELQRRRYPAAAALWKQLLSVLPPDSDDHRTVQANLDEAMALANGAGSAGR